MLVDELCFWPLSAKFKTVFTTALFLLLFFYPRSFDIEKKLKIVLRVSPCVDLWLLCRALLFYALDDSSFTSSFILLFHVCCRAPVCPLAPLFSLSLAKLK